MIASNIEFKKDEYDPLIDYIKGLCIIFVVMTHSMSRTELNNILFPFWGDTAVPIFLILQAFHYYKKGFNVVMPSIHKLWKRIIAPFIMMIALMFLTQYFMYYDVTGGNFYPKLYWDKRGPGSYYIFIFLEFSIIIPLFALLFRRLSWKWSLIVFVFFSQLFEILSCVNQCPDSIYRILFLRYFFLIFLGYLIATKGIVLNKLTIIVGMIGVIFMYIFNYTDSDMEPLFYTSLVNWKYCHWVCYLYIFYILLWLLNSIYIKLESNCRLQNCLIKIGRSSYEIYLFQLFYYATIGTYVNNVLSYLDNSILRKILYVVSSMFICICIPSFRNIVKKL